MDIIDFKPYVKVYLDETSGLLRINRPYRDQKQIYCYKLSKVGLDIIKNINGKNSLDDLKKITLDNNINSIEEFNKIIDMLYKECYIKNINDNIDINKNGFFDEFERLLPIWSNYESQTINKYDIQKNIMSKKIGIIGCGTVGFGIISDLVANGIGNFILVDRDTVELSNLTRQPLFSKLDIGKYKTGVIKCFIDERRSNCNVQVYNKNILKKDDLNIFKNVDMIIVSGDFPSYEQLSTLVQNFVIENSIPICFSGGYNANSEKFILCLYQIKLIALIV